MAFEDVSLLTRLPIQGSCSGVYFLYDDQNLVYIGEGWNCFLRVAEHTRKDSVKNFTHWTFIPIEGRDERKQLEKELRHQYKPKYNRV